MPPPPRLIAAEVRWSLLRWEPRVDIADVVVSTDPDDAATLWIDIRYTVQGDQRPAQPGLSVLRHPRARCRAAGGRRARRVAAMTLPTPRLDDRTFQQLVDEAKRHVQQHCPEWTDHNVSDPGVTLIETFAWMTDMLLYRLEPGARPSARPFPGTDGRAALPTAGRAHRASASGCRRTSR